MQCVRPLSHISSQRRKLRNAFPRRIRSGAPDTPSEPIAPAPIQFEEDVIVPLSELERRAIMHALKVTRNNVTRAARALGIGRATMYRKLDRYKIDQNA